MTLITILNQIQKTLKAPKNQVNKFGGYKYRNCEDILEALKHVLPDGVVITVQDDITIFGDRVYVKATAQITDGKDAISTTAFAREPFQKKGMDDSQITGAASSYARKYALSGLLLIDDTKDADSHDNRSETETETRLRGIAEEIVFEILGGNLKAAAKVWGPLSDEDKKELWKARTKGGYFDQKIKQVMQSPEFREAHK